MQAQCIFSKPNGKAHFRELPFQKYLFQRENVLECVQKAQHKALLCDCESQNYKVKDNLRQQRVGWRVADSDRGVSVVKSGKRKEGG